MTSRSILTRGVVGLAGAALLAGAFAVPSIASAQSYRPAYQNGGYYDPCRRDQVNRGTGGALVGGGLGALAGSSIAGRGAKTEGAVLGGILGAVIGSNVGKSGAACDSAYDPSYRGSRTGYYDTAPRDGYYGYQEPSYQQGYYDDRYSRDDYYVAPVTQAPTADNCTLAESPIYLPDGRTQKRFVRVCRDARGNYQVVD